ncbi:hypothetical protein [Magnetospira sp. QH-2]|uniref:hypothetical protein n=1 Tax=Magnetospira sp. (strain QH-2) TaxID=1288970 RepID=UPI0005F9EA0B|nr:hypothetical protein [Magnetospira sp. QH-2]
MRCPKCPSDMTLEQVGGKKHWVCDDCGYARPQGGVGAFLRSGPVLVGLVIGAAVAVLALTGA